MMSPLTDGCTWNLFADNLSPIKKYSVVVSLYSAMFDTEIANISGNYTAINVFRYELFVGLLAFVTTPASAQDQVTALSGNVIFGAFFTVNELDNGDCGDYSAGHLEEVIAVTWFLKSLNDRNYIPGIKIGQKPYHDTERRKFGLKLTVLSDGKADIPGIRTMASEP